MRIVRLLLTAWLLALVPANLSAQSVAEIRGVAADESGGVLPGVTVTVTNELTGVPRTMTSDDGGRFNFPRLLVGTYRLEASLDGFRPFVTSNVRLDADDIRQINVVMTIGALTDVLTVRAAVTEVQTVGGSLSAVVDEKRISELPLNGRDPLQLQLLLPGVVVGNGSNRTSEVAAIAVHGLRGTTNNYMLDGGDNNDQLMGVASILPNPDALEEFSVQTSNFSAEFGRNMGAAINAVTKSGTNTFKGSLYEFVRDDKFDAKDFFAVEKGKLQRDHFGGTLGGPIARDRIFFFAAYEGLREETGATRSNVIVPTAAERAGDFSQSVQKPRDPVTGQLFPGSQIPSNRFDPATEKFLGIFVPLPNQATGQYIFNAPSETDGDQLMGRIDYVLNSKQRLFGRAFHDKNGLINTGGLPIIQNFIDYTTKNIAVNHSYVITQRLVSSLQFTYARNTFDVGALPVPGNISHQSLGIKVNRGGGSIPDGVELPPLLGESVTGYFQTGQEAYQPRDRPAYQLKEDLSYSRGSHMMKFGGEYRFVKDFRTAGPAVDGTFTFNGQYSGNAFADFLLGRASAMTQGSVRRNDGRSRAFSLYAQDDWQIRSTLTVSAGLRWDPFFAFYDVLQPAPVFRPGQQSVLFPSAPLGALYAGDPGLPRGGHPTRWNNFAPRLAVAWSPQSKTSMRAGYGLFYDSGRFFGGPASITFAPPYSVTSTINGVQFSDPYAGMVNPFPYHVPETQAERDNYRYFLPALYESVAEDRAGGYTHQWNVSIQRETVANIVLTAAYVGNKGIKMPILRDINPAVYRPGATLADRQSRRLYPQFQTIESMDNVGESRYHGLELSANKRFSKGYTIIANYTYGSAFDNASGDNNGTGQNPFDIGNDWGPADSAVRHRMVTSFLWQLPSPSGKVAKAVLGGWQFNGIVTFASGLPFTVSSGRDTMLSFFTSRADQIADPNLPTDRPRGELIAMYFDPTAFAVPATGTLGNTGRNFMTGPGSRRADLSLFRSFKLPKGFQLQFRAEAFNAFNGVPLNNPVANITSATVGRITSTGPARVMQFGLRMTF